MHNIIFGDGVSAGIDIAIQYEFKMYPPVDVIRYLYPMGAQLYTFFSVWMSFSFLGLLMYLISLIKKNIVLGMSVAVFFIFLDPLLVYLAEGTFGYWVELFSPVCWTSIDQMQSTNRFFFMNVPLALGLYTVLIVLSGVAIWRISRRTEIEIRR